MTVVHLLTSFSKEIGILLDVILKDSKMAEWYFLGRSTNQIGSVKTNTKEATNKQTWEKCFCQKTVKRPRAPSEASSATLSAEERKTNGRCRSALSEMNWQRDRATCSAFQKSWALTPVLLCVLFKYGLVTLYREMPPAVANTHLRAETPTDMFLFWFHFKNPIKRSLTRELLLSSLPLPFLSHFPSSSHFHQQHCSFTCAVHIH